MDDEKVQEGQPPVPESPKPLAFTIDFGNDKKIDTQRHKTLAEKFQKRHKRGQSLTKLEDTPPQPPKHQTPLSANLPRKSSFQSDGYFSSDEKNAAKTTLKRTDLTLFLKNCTGDRMTQSFPTNTAVTSPEQCDLKDVSSPELEPISPLEPHRSSPVDNEQQEVFTAGPDFDFDKKSDTVSDAGTYTVEADNYSEEQKARMSIDKEFKIEKVSVQKKTEEYVRSLVQSNLTRKGGKVLSPILSPTQNISTTNGDKEQLNKTFTKIMFPSPRAKRDGLEEALDRGAVISVTSSGAFRSDEKRRSLSLTKSEVHVEAYIDGTVYKSEPVEVVAPKERTKRLTANIVNVQSIEVNPDVVSGSLVLGKLSNGALPPVVGGKTSPTKIPSPIHTLSRPRSRNSLSGNLDFSDTEIILKPTQNYINSLQQRLSLDSDQDSDYDAKYGLQLNNTAHLLKQKTSHTRHNSLDDRTMNNKLEHFQSKNLQGIDQTYNLLNQYKVQNSPNNSPIRRSSSFSTKNQLKNTNVTQVTQEHKMVNSPRNSRIQRSSSTASIKPYVSNRRSSIGERKKIDRSQFGDTESSSEDDFNVQKRKDLGNISNTRCNRAFSLRRARIDNESTQLKCPNTPEMRRKTFHSDNTKERAISVDRKPMKTNDVQSRYLSNVTKRGTPPPKEVKSAPKSGGTPLVKKPPQSFSRTDSGRFSMRSTKPVAGVGTPKSAKKDGKKQGGGGGRSNSSLSSREVEFQNWKRRKSYDPMKAAAEGKRKEMQKKMGQQNVMTQSFTESSHSPDSSPSHSGSVHRSQSFHGTAALEQLISSDEEDLTLSAEEGFSPPTPSPCELSPARASLRHALWERIHH